MSPQQLRALRFIAKYGTTRGGHFAPNTISSLSRKHWIQYKFSSERDDAGWHITDLGTRVLINTAKEHRP